MGLCVAHCKRCLAAVVVVEHSEIAVRNKLVRVDRAGEAGITRNSNSQGVDALLLAVSNGDHACPPIARPVSFVGAAAAHDNTSDPRYTAQPPRQASHN